MIKKRRKQLIYFNVFSDILAVSCSFISAYLLRFYSEIFASPRGIPVHSDYLMILPVILIVQLLSLTYMGYYKVKLRRNRLDDLFLVFFNTVVSSVFVLLIFSYFKSYGFTDFQLSHLFVFIYIPVSLLFISFFRFLVFSFFKSWFLKKNGISQVLIAGTGELGRMVGENLNKYNHFGIRIAGFLSKTGKGGNVLGKYGDVEKVVKKYGITDLFIAISLKEFKTVIQLMESGNNLLIDTKLIPDIVYLSSLKMGMEHLEGIPVINLGDIPLHGWKLFLKNVFDKIFSLIGLVVAAIPIGIIAVLIKISSKGPVFYTQKRVGLDGKIFRIIKFRTMIDNAEKNTGAIWSPVDDKRVTGVGKVLRKFSIDEIPQLINVLRGQMSLVGPRPERPELVKEFRDSIPRYMLRHTVKAGITGWAQVHGLRGNTPLNKRIEYDLYYIQNWTMKLDFEILWRTILKFQFVDKNN